MRSAAVYDLDVARLEVQRLNSEVDALKAEKRDLLEQLKILSCKDVEASSGAQGDSEALSDALEQLRLCRDDLEKEREGRQRTREMRDSVEEKWRTSEKERSNMARKITELDAALQEQSRDMEMLRMELDGLRKENATLQWERQRADTEERQESHELVSKLRNERDSALAENSQLQGTLLEQDARLVEYYNRISEDQKTLESLKSEKAIRIMALEGKLHEEREKMNVQLEAANKMVVMLEQKNKELEENAQMLRGECEKFDATVKEYSEECTKLLKDVENISEETKQARLERDGFQQKVNNLLGTLSSRNEEIESLRSQLGLGGVVGAAPSGLPQQQQRSVTQMLMATNLGTKQDRGMGSARFEGQSGSARFEGQSGSARLESQSAAVYPRDSPQGEQRFGNQLQRFHSQNAMEQGGGEAPARVQMMRQTNQYGEPLAGAMGGSVQSTMPPTGGPMSFQPTSSAPGGPMSMQPLLPPRMQVQQMGQMGPAGQMNQLGLASQMNQGVQPNQMNQLGLASQMNQGVQPNQMGPGSMRLASEDRFATYGGSGMPRNGSYESVQRMGSQSQISFPLAQNKMDGSYGPPYSQTTVPIIRPASETKAAPRGGKCSDPCPICGRNDFATVAELETHSAKCTDFKY